MTHLAEGQEAEAIVRCVVRNKANQLVIGSGWHLPALPLGVTAVEHSLRLGTGCTEYCLSSRRRSFFEWERVPKIGTIVRPCGSKQAER